MAYAEQESWLAEDRWNNSLWRSDDGLAEMQQALESHPKAVFLDFFDTLVFRLCAQPIDAFIEMGRRLKKLCLLAAHVDTAQFAVLRRIAETSARASVLLERGTAEVHLHEIHAQMNKVVSDISAMAAVELQVEREWCCINPSMASLVHDLTKAGTPVIIVSDTYLSAEHLASILSYNGLNPARFAAIYTSCDHGCSKSEGRLFKFVLERMNLHPAMVLHVGDNEYADVNGAAAAGIKAIHYKLCSPAQRTVLTREEAIQSEARRESSLQSLRTLAQRLCLRLPEHERADFKDGAFLFGPVLARYADWCVEQFRTLKVKRIIALMREGTLLATLLRRAACAVGVELDVVPAFVSRSSTNLASLGTASLERLRPLAMKRNRVTVSELLACFEVSPQDANLSKRAADELIKTDEQFEELLQRLSRPPLRGLIEAKSAQRRAALVGYLHTLIGFQSRLGLMDLGYGCTIQRNLVEVLRLEGLEITIHGRYLATNERAAPAILNGIDARGFLDHLGVRPEQLNCLINHPEVLEQVVSDCLGSTERHEADHQGSFRPVFGVYRCSPEEQRRKRLVQEGILQFQRQWLTMLLQKKYRCIEGQLPPSFFHGIDLSLPAIIQRLFAFPLTEEALRLGSYHHDDNNGVDSWNSICDEKERAAFRAGGLEALAKMRAYWPHGIVAIERPDIFELFFKMREAVNRL